MRIRQAKLMAFSLQETMVALIITSVVVGMAFAVLNLVQRQMGSIESIYAIKTGVNQLRQSLWIDFNRYARVTYDPIANVLQFSNEMGDRTYQVMDNAIRTQNLEMAFESIEFYFDNRNVTSGEIDAISIRTSLETGHQEIFVFKENTPSTYINQPQ